jgi:hypothetical protein
LIYVNAKTVSGMPLEDTAHRETVREAAKTLYLSLDERAKVAAAGACGGSIATPR